MAELPSLPSLPEWVPFPRVVWFVAEGVVIGLVGFLLREALPGVESAVTIGNVAFFVGGVSALLGIVAYLVLIATNR